MMQRDMRIGSLFSGIGGLELGLEWAGVGHVVWQVERDPFPRSVLAKHWPKADRGVTDVRKAGSATLPYVDVICGGFPCQDISYAGKGAGLAGERSGLWYEFARVIREMGPRYVVIENVSALIARGLDQVLGTLADIGYDAQWRTIRASDVGAPHRRERLFIVAHPIGERRERWFDTRVHEGSKGWNANASADVQAMANANGTNEQTRGADRMGDGSRTCRSDKTGSAARQSKNGREIYGGVANANELRRNWWPGEGDDGARIGEPTNGGAIKELANPNAVGFCYEATERELDGQRFAKPSWNIGEEAACIIESGVGREPDGLSGWLDRWPAAPGEDQYEWEQPRTIAKCANRSHRLKALGNAVVPAVAREVGRWLLEIEAQR
jgi:DNA (cytosine-5)-methyltransferase 1